MLHSNSQLSSFCRWQPMRYIWKPNSGRARTTKSLQRPKRWLSSWPSSASLSGTIHYPHISFSRYSHNCCLSYSVNWSLFVMYQFSLFLTVPAMTKLITDKNKYMWMALFLWVPIFVDWTKMTQILGSKFVAIVFSFIIHTENYHFVGTGIRWSDPPRKPRKLVPHEI